MADQDGNDLPTISDDLVVTKYKMAAEIVNSKYNTFSLPKSGQNFLLKYVYGKPNTPIPEN